MDADHYLEKLIKEKLSKEEIERFDRLFGLVETSIGRMVPTMTPEMQKGDPLRVCVEPYSFLPIDSAAFKGELPSIPEIVAYTPFSYFLKRKLYMHNMSHAIAAYLGQYAGKLRIDEALALPEIKLVVLRALTESAIALSLSFEKSFSELDDHAMDLVSRFQNSALGDTTARVGADIPRKLAPKDRLIGALREVEKQGRKPAFIVLGIAAALFQHAKETASEAAKLLPELTEISADEAVFSDILHYVDMMKGGATISELIRAVEVKLTETKPALI